VCWGVLGRGGREVEGCGAHMERREGGEGMRGTSGERWRERESRQADGLEATQGCGRRWSVEGLEAREVEGGPGPGALRGQESSSALSQCRSSRWPFTARAACATSCMGALPSRARQVPSPAQQAGTSSDAVQAAHAVSVSNAGTGSMVFAVGAAPFNPMQKAEPATLPRERLAFSPRQVLVHVRIPKDRA
jgi:hypothetical protein